MIETKDSLEFLKTFDDFTFDINYSDPPYQLGSEVIIRKDGKVDYKKSVDFMNKWGGLSGEYWEQWFKEAYRTLKNGGYCIMFGMDRQLLLFKYYANLAGFEEQQSLYWYFISNFPKATDLSKQIDKRGGGNFDTNQIAKSIKEARLKRKMTVSECDKLFCDSSTNWTWFEGRKAGVRPPTYDTFMKIANEWQELLSLAELVKEVERDVIGKKTSSLEGSLMGLNKNCELDSSQYGKEIDITTPSTDLAKKYEGYKYSISPLKQTNETIMVFRKPYKSGSCLHDTLAFENGDNECRCGALNIDGNRVPSNEEIKTTTMSNFSEIGKANKKVGVGGGKMGFNFHDEEISRLEYEQKDGRYPSQTFCGGVNLTIMVLDDTIDLETKNEIRSCYDELYLQSLREKVLSIAVKSEEWQGEVLQKGLLLPGSKSDNERKKSSELWEKENTRNNSQVEKDLGIKGQEQGTFSELEGWHNKGKGLHNGRLSELPGKILGYATTNDQKEQQNDIATQNCDGYTLEQSINEGGHSSPQERSEKRQPSGELGNIQPTRTPSSAQKSRKENERTRVTDRTFTERDTFIEKEFIPEKWLKHFTYACDILVSTAEVLDKQSGNLKQSTRTYNDKGEDTSWFATPQNKVVKGDIGGCSKILHKCNYEKEDYDIYNYQPKVSKSERNAGCDGDEQQYSHDGRNKEIENPYQRNKSVAINNHPTLKPIALNEKILKLFKTPNDDKIVYPFAGSGSEIIGGIKAGFNNWVGCEINPDYVEIAKARIDYWTTQDNQLTIFDLEC